MNTTKNGLMTTIYAILNKGKTHYCIPRPGTLLDLLKKFHGIEIHHRWLFQCLQDLGAAGYITRQPRWNINEDLSVRRLPALLALTTKGVKYLSSKYVHGARQLLRQMIAWLNRDDSRWPKPQTIIQPQPISDRGDGLTHIQEIIKALI